MKQKTKILIFAISLAALLLSACNAPATATPTQAVDAIYTAAAQTVAAQAAKNTATPRPSATPSPTATVTIAPTVLATQVPPTSPGQNFCDNSVYISDVTIPDNTELAPGQVFDKTWALQNTGTCTWTEGYTIIFSNGDQMGGNTRPIGQVVAPGAQVNVTVKLTAPTTPGAYSGFWRLANGKGAPFGQVVSVVIKVVVGSTATQSAATATTGPAATKTSTSAPAATVTATQPPTATVTPTVP
ncbi:MAG TPA: NBR1-Ig-like domain-containing protein [Anaerolineales bacterium]